MELNCRQTSGSCRRRLVGHRREGLGDHDGLRIVAEYLVRTLGEYDAAFASDLAHLLLSYELYSVAEPLVIEAATSMPGDVSAKFHLGVIHKFARRWSDALDAFQSVAAIRPGGRHPFGILALRRPR